MSRIDRLFKDVNLGPPAFPSIVQRLNNNFRVQTLRIFSKTGESVLERQVLFDAPEELIHIICPIFGPIFYTDHIQGKIWVIYWAWFNWRVAIQMHWHFESFILILWIFHEGLLHLHPSKFVGLLVAPQLSHYVIHVYVCFGAFPLRHRLYSSLYADFGSKKCFLFDNWPIKFWFFVQSSRHGSVMTSGCHKQKQDCQIAPRVCIAAGRVKSEIFGWFPCTSLLFLLFHVVRLLFLRRCV